MERLQKSQDKRMDQISSQVTELESKLIKAFSKLIEDKLAN